MILNQCVKKKVKHSHYRPGQGQRIPGSEGSQISRQRHRMVEGCQPYAPAAFTPQEVLLVFISVRGWVDPRAIVRSEGFYINEKSTDTGWNRTSDLPICNTAPWPLCYRGPPLPGLAFKNSTWCSLGFEWFERISEQTTTFAFYSINRLVFITVAESVYSAVRTDFLYKADYV